MKLILSDRPLPIDCDRLGRADVTYIDLSALKIANCTGCYGCWTRTPGKCVIRDDAVSVYPVIAKSDTLLYVSRIRYGGYDTIMKTMLERAIPETSCQGLFNQIHKKATKKVPGSTFMLLTLRQAGHLRPLNSSSQRYAYSGNWSI